MTDGNLVRCGACKDPKSRDGRQKFLPRFTREAQLDFPLVGGQVLWAAVLQAPVRLAWRFNALLGLESAPETDTGLPLLGGPLLAFKERCIQGEAAILRAAEIGLAALIRLFTWQLPTNLLLQQHHTSWEIDRGIPELMQQQAAAAQS